MMGNVYTEEELEAVIARAKEVGAIVIVDEAYHYFYDKTFLPYALKEENVILLRTFSKAMSLAAVRLGVRQSWGVLLLWKQVNQFPKETD